MKHLPAIFCLFLLMVCRGIAVEFEVFRVAVSLPFGDSSFVNQVDRFSNTRVGNIQLINLAQGLPFRTRVPRNRVLAVLLPKVSSPSDSPQLVLFDTTTKTVLLNIATFTLSSVLAPDDSTKPFVGLISGNIPGFSTSDFSITGSFTLQGAFWGISRNTSRGRAVDFRLTGLHGGYTRSHPTIFFYGSSITAAAVRIAGLPIATIDL